MLEERLDGEVRFAHQQLQEYFAARHWVYSKDAAAFEQAQKGQRIGDAKLGEALEDVVARLQPHEALPKRPATGWEETALMAVSLAKGDDFLQALADCDLVTAGRAAEMPNSGVADETKAKLQKRLAACLLDPAMELRTRIDAGMVTNAEFALFMRAGGYDDERWWPKGESRSWWKAEREDTQAEDTARFWRGLSDERVAQLISERGWSKSEQDTLRHVREACWEDAVAMYRPVRHPALDKRPRYWLDATLNGPAQPIVGICFFEAKAFSLWLSRVSGQRIDLPAEAHWEAAARGTHGLRWSFGPALSALRANTTALCLRNTSPVGAFMRDDDPSSWADLGGNIWEWTDSEWSEKHRSTSKPEFRVVRGGFWDGPLNFARGACRGRSPLDLRSNSRGFRVCSGPPAVSKFPEISGGEAGISRNLV
ncbi:MAG: SUMF1/EgtB/PvdO family nonheme iron enzyme [Myxococcota bacterium]